MRRKVVTPAPSSALIAIFAAILAACCGGEAPDDTEVSLAVDTYVSESGLLEVLLPSFEGLTGYEVSVVPGAERESLAAARSGAADVLFMGDPDEEEAFVAEGYGVNRQLVMRDAIDLELARVYHVMQVEPAKVEDVNAEGASLLIEFLISDEGQGLIADFRIAGEANPPFLPQADESGEGATSLSAGTIDIH